MYGKNGKIRFLIFNAIFAIVYSAPIICYIYIAGFYNFANTNKDEIEIAQDIPQISEIPETINRTETLEITETTNISNIINTTNKINTTEMIETTENTTETAAIPETTKIIETAEAPATTIQAAAAPPLPAAPIATAAVPEPVPPPVIYDEVPQSDFLQKMFENAIEIPKTVKNVEQPPKGRSVDSQWKIVPLSAEIPEPFGYFKNIIFLGDSVTIGFDLYRSKIKYDGQNVLRDATVIASGSYGVFNSAKEISATSIHPLYDGKQTLPEDIIEKLDAKIVFICLGLNDVALNTTEKYVEYYKYLIDRIKYKSPDKTVVIMSVTPTVEGVKVSLNNAKIMAANDALIDYAFENDIPFIDYAAVLRDSNNSLYKSLASDGFCHLTIEAYNRLVTYILHHPVQ